MRVRDDAQTVETALRVALSAAVELRLEALRRLDGHAFAALYDRARLDALAQTVAEHGDDLLFRSGKRGECAAVFNAVADGIAVLAFAPGGVSIFGETYEATR